MFRRNGYSPVYLVRDKFLEGAQGSKFESDDWRYIAARSILRNARQDDARARKTKFFSEPTEDEVNAVSRNRDVDVFLQDRAWRVFQDYMSSIPLFLVGPDGGIDQIDKMILRNRRPFRLKDFSGGDWIFLDSRYMYVSTESALIEANAASVFMNSWIIEKFSASSRRLTETIAKSGILAKMLSRFDGYSLSIEDKLFPSNDSISEMLRHGSSAGEGTAANGGDKVIGDNLRYVAECFYTAYPEGKEGTGDTWEEVQEKLGFSRRTINRALARYVSNP
ncbi:hypothetical protein [Paracoccus sp. IB05]|uniref:hypothetical protein n=1 Tax=Paracoccus sp. IB05 TaxID=2779367 RepID=UPI0018E8DE77|nr:hypothetical protein [Paracoccus sp. IB05]MBJ2153993.1 hypothetical protein [Paracoccus sp. IB05]